MHRGWHGTHRYDIQVLATHTSTWVHRYSSLLQWSVSLGHRGHVAMVGRILCTKCTLHSNHRLTVWYSNIPTHKTTSPPGRPFSHYINSHSLAAEMWTTMKNNLLGGKFFSCSFFLYRIGKYGSYGFPVINFCNPGVHYETPCTLWNALYIMKRPVHYVTPCTLWNVLCIMKRPVHYETPCTLWNAMYIMKRPVHYETLCTLWNALYKAAEFWFFEGLVGTF